MNDRTLLCHGKEVEEESFRPQQGLTIMNQKGNCQRLWQGYNGFRPQQGLTIMNKKMKIINDSVASFRPQQGLTIMNTFM